MSHPELLKQKFDKRECRGRSLLPGTLSGGQVIGVSPNHSFFFFCTPPQAAQEVRERSRGHPCNPGQGLAALDNPPWEAAGKESNARSKNSG